MAATYLPTTHAKEATVKDCLAANEKTPQSTLVSKLFWAPVESSWSGQARSTTIRFLWSLANYKTKLNNKGNE